MLEVVEQKQQALVAHMLGQPVSRSDGLRRLLEHEPRIAERRQRHPEDAVGESFRALGRCLQREPRLARSAGPGESQQPCPGEQPHDLRQLALATDEGRRGYRQVRPVERLERREVRVAELVDPLRSAQVLKPVLREVKYQVATRIEQCLGGGRDEHLPPVAGRGDAGGPVNVRTDVALVGQKRRPRVEAHPHRDLQTVLGFPRRGDSSRSGRKRDEEGVPLRIYLDPAVAGAGLAQHAPMLCQRLRIALRPELVQQLRRPLHVGEEERNGAGRKLALHGSGPRRALALPVPGGCRSDGRHCADDPTGPSRRLAEAVDPGEPRDQEADERRPRQADHD